MSPRGSGLYMSFLLHPQMDFSQATLLTCITAVAVCRAIEKAAGISPSIKWVNDLYLENKKIAGILTEGHASLEDGGLDHVVVGIGINIGQPRGGWPGELAGIAGCLRDSTNANPDRNILAGYIISELESAMATPSGELVEEYRNRSMLIGKYVQINSFGREQAKSRKEYALVTGIDDNCRLLVRMDSGAEGALSTGEVSVVQY